MGTELANAELELQKRPEERVRFLQGMVKATENLLEVAKAKHASGVEARV